LLDLQKMLQRKRPREVSPESDLCCDDLDENYKPSKNDINSSDSEDNTPFAGLSPDEEREEPLPVVLAPRKRKRRKVGPRKKQPTSVQKGKSQGLRPPQKRKSAIQIALTKSVKMAHVHKMFEKYHHARLDNLLLSNNLHRIAVKGDGNCFLNAVLHQVDNEIHTIESLRSDIADHLGDNYDHYKMFLTARDVTEPTDSKQNYLREVETVRESGTWNMDLADCMPLALSNIMRRPVRIYTSKMQNPVIDVEPDLVEQSCVNNPHILIACTAICGKEHYDAIRESGMRGTGIECINDQNKTPRRNNPEPIITPHKQARYRSPARRKLFRKKSPKVTEWKRNKRKNQKSKGLSYVSCNGKMVSSKKMEPVDCTKCRSKCSTKISEDERQELFDTYWNMGDYDKQRSFLCQNTTQRDTKSGKKKMKFTSFHFTVKENTFRVCRNFFLKTLNIGKKTVEVALRQKSHGTFVGADKRGKQCSWNKIPQHLTNLIHQHIRSFPVMESHYSRAKSKKQYLSGDLNIKVMYGLFKQKYFADTTCPIKESKYRKTFCENYNLSFHKPKKDQCSTCTLYYQQKESGDVDEETESDYNRHQQMKEWAREEKIKDKERAKHQKDFHVSTFDLEAVLSTPCSLVGELYYKRKLSCYNLSFYSLSDQKGTCYLWDETQGGRGCNEVGSCVLKQIDSIVKQHNAKEITFYSDTCGGQNRNQFMASGLLYAIKEHRQLQKLNQKFFEPGHSQMESDSIHSAVEHAKKNTQIFVPSQWATVISMARRNKPYIVIPLRFEDFYDLKTLKSGTASNMKVEVSGMRVNWLNIKWIQVRQETPESLFVNYTFDPTQFLEIRVTRGRCKPQTDILLTNCFQAKLPISVAKKNDLLSLCRSKIIPEEFHSYYDSLDTNKALKDKLDDIDDSDYNEADEVK